MTGHPTLSKSDRRVRSFWSRRCTAGEIWRDRPPADRAGKAGGDTSHGAPRSAGSTSERSSGAVTNLRGAGPGGLKSCSPRVWSNGRVEMRATEAGAGGAFFLAVALGAVGLGALDAGSMTVDQGVSTERPLQVARGLKSAFDIWG